MAQSVTMSSDMFFDNIKTGVFHIPIKLFVPSQLISDYIQERFVLVVTSFSSGLEIEKYIPIHLQTNSPYFYPSPKTRTIDYEKKEILYYDKYLEEPIVITLPSTITLISLCNVDDWQNAIELGYEMVVDAIKEHETTSNTEDALYGIYFTNNDVYRNLCGNSNKIGTTIRNEINTLLLENGYKWEISLYGCDGGSSVSVRKINT